MILIACDLETLPISEGSIRPSPACLTIAFGHGDPSGIAACESGFVETLLMLFDPQVATVWHNAKFDLGVLYEHYPLLRPAIYQALSEGRVRDTMIIQQLANLREHGRLRGIAVPSGDPENPIIAKRFEYSLAGIYEEHFGVDVSERKEDGVRLSFEALVGVPFEDYPPEFRDYALQDAEMTLRVYEEQRDRYGELPTEWLQVQADFALSNMTARGVALDEKAFLELRTRTLAARDWRNFPHMIAKGVLRAPLPERPFKNQQKRATALLGCAPDRDFEKEPCSEDELEALQQDGVRIAAPKQESLDMSALRKEIEAECRRSRTEVLKTETGLVSTESDFIEEIKAGNPVICEYAERQKYGKIITTELPRMCRNRDISDPAPVVHPDFRILKETGRTSSAATDLYPSFNCQNVDPRARGCYVARPGMLLCSVDFGAQDLVSLAQVCLNTFGRSKLAENFNAGKDPHGYLGSVLATHMGGQGSFSYESFMALKEGDEEARAFWKHYRTFAKPTGLGFPGGLGAETFVKYARGTFGVETTTEEARRIKDIWLHAYPEMVDYFAYVNDVLCSGVDEYTYTSPLGMVRSRATYCAACNGFGLQTPSAEATKLATWNLDRACFDEAAENKILFGSCWPLMQIHDEIIVEFPEDEVAHDRAFEVARIMRKSMRIITPDVKVKAEPALMRRWNKGAGPVFDNAGRLTVWKE